ncbi:uncharacterized mitochondrial protein-like protein [Tanacetum coccineum]
MSTNRVYKFEKALYGLHQAPRAWYETLSTYLLDNRFQRGKIYKTLFIKRHKGDILLVEVYVDDIIFGLTKKELCNTFEKLMHKKFQMSSMGLQKKDGIFISQDKYVVEILKKFGFTEVKTASTPIETQKPLLKDEDGEEVDVHMYKSMIGSLMYLTSLRPDIMFSVYLKGQPKLDLWYPKYSPFDLVAYTDSDYTRASLDRKSTTGGGQFLGCRLISWQCKKQTVVANSLIKAEYVAASSSTVRRDLQLEDAEGIDYLPNSTIFEELTRMGSKTTAWDEFSSTMAYAIICLATNQKFNFSKYIFESMVRNLDNLSGKFLMYPRKPKRKDTQVPQPSGPTNIVADKAVHKELGDSLVRVATTASSLEAEEDSGNITKTRSKATPNKSSSLGTTSGGGPRCQETMGDTISQTRFENVSKHSNDSLLARGNTLRSDGDSLKLNKLMELCTNLQSRVLDLEKTKTTQANEIASLKRRVKKLEKKRSSITHKLKRLFKGRRINAIDADEDITLVNVQDDADNEIFDVDALTGDEVFAEQEVAAKDVNLTIDEVTLAQALAALKSVKPKVSAATTTTATIPTLKRELLLELGTPTTIISSQQSQDKGKGIMIEEPVKPKKKDVQIMLDEEAAKKLQAEFDEEERLAREKDEANVALTEEWDDIQAKIEADHELAQRLQAEEQEELSVEEKAKLFQQLLEQRRKHFAAKRAEEQRNKPPTQAQQRKIMCTYLKNMEGKKLKDLKNKSFDSIQKMFDRAFDRVNTFVYFRTDLVKGSSKRAGEELEQESTKKQKMDEDKDTVELQILMEVISDEEEVAIDVVPLATKSLKIVGWKIHKEGKKSYYQIIRADGKSQMYRIFSQMIKSFNREDLEDLYKLVKARYGSTRPVESMDYLLWNDLKIMFEPHVEDEVWKLQNGYKVLE